MTATTTRPLPLDLAMLRQHYMPDPPADSAVVRARQVIANLDVVSTIARAELEQHDLADRDAVAELVDQALDGPLEQLVADLHPGDRAVLAHRVAQLESARNDATYRLTRAEFDDPVHLEWKATCERIVRDWQLATSSDSPDQRFADLAAFVASH